jgi:hypothetical protein
MGSEPKNICGIGVLRKVREAPEGCNRILAVGLLTLSALSAIRIVPELQSAPSLDGTVGTELCDNRNSKVRRRADEEIVECQEF